MMWRWDYGMGEGRGDLRYSKQAALPKTSSLHGPPIETRGSKLGGAPNRREGPQGGPKTTQRGPGSSDISDSAPGK